MRIIKPHQITGQYRCAVLPNRSSDPDGFIDTGRVLSGWDPQITVSISAVKEMARLIGWYPPEEVEDKLARVREMEQELSELREQVDALTQAHKTIEAISRKD